MPLVDLNQAPNWAVVASCIAAWVALTISSFNLVISWKSYGLNRAKEDRMGRNLSVYYDRGFYTNREDNSGRDYSFIVTISNNSDSPVSITKLEMKINYINEKGVSLERNFLPSADRENSTINPSIHIPNKIDSKQAISGKLSFFVDSEFINQVYINEYTVSIIDIYGLKTEINPIVILEKSPSRKAAHV